MSNPFSVVMVSQALHTLDYVILGVILFSGLISLFRGFIREAMSLITWVLAAWFVLHFSDMFADYLTRYVHTEGLRLAISAMLVIMVTLLVGMILSQLLMMVVRFTGLSGLDRFIGFFFGIGRGVLITLLGLVLAKSAHMDDQDWWTGSVMVPQFKPAIAWAEEWLPNNMDKLTQLFYHAHPKKEGESLQAQLPKFVSEKLPKL